MRSDAAHAEIELVSLSDLALTSEGYISDSSVARLAVSAIAAPDVADLFLPQTICQQLGLTWTNDGEIAPVDVQFKNRRALSNVQLAASSAVALDRILIHQNLDTSES